MKENHIRNGAILSYAETFVRIGVNIFYVPVLLKYIGKSEYGLYQLIASIMAYLTIMESSLSSGTLRYYCKSKAKGNSEETENVLAISQYVNYAVAAIIFVGCLILIASLDFLYGNSLTARESKEAKLMFLVLGINSAINLSNYVYYAIINGNERFEFLKILNIISLIIQPITVLCIVRRSPYAVSIVLVQLAISICVTSIRKWYAIKKLKTKIILHNWDLKIAYKMFAFTGAIFLVAIADQIFWRSGQLILGKLYNTSIVAVYAVGIQIYNIYMSIGTAISSVFFPRLSILAQNNKTEEISNLFIGVGRITLIICGMVLSGFGLYGKEFLLIWTGPGYEEAYYVALIIMVPFTIDLMQNIGLSILQIYDKYLFRGKMYFAVAILNIFLNVFLAKKYQGIGSAVATAISVFIGTGIIMNIYYAKAMKLPIKKYWKNMAKLVLAIIFCTIIGNVISKISITNYIIEFALHVVLYVCVYIAVIVLLALNKNEKDYLKNWIFKSNSKVDNI